jgi:hypothetical protein
LEQEKRCPNTDNCKETFFNKALHHFI